MNLELTKYINNIHKCNVVNIININYMRLSNYLKDNFESYEVMNAVECIFTSIIKHNSNIKDDGIYNLNDTIQKWFTNMVKFGAASVEGSVFSINIGNVSDLFITKLGTPGSDSNLLHEYVVGHKLNELRKYIPTFMYTYGIFKCPYPNIDFKNEITGLCNNKGNNGDKVAYAIFERIKGKDLADIVANLTFVEYLEILIQISMSLQLAYDKFKFTHYDLHAGNITVRLLPTKRWVNYPWGRIYTDKIPVIIDYGFSHIKIDSVTYSKTGYENSGIVKKPNIAYDLFKIIGFTLDIIERKGNYIKTLFLIIHPFLKQEFPRDYIKIVNLNFGHQSLYSLDNYVQNNLHSFINHIKKYIPSFKAHGQILKEPSIDISSVINNIIPVAHQNNSIGFLKSINNTVKSLDRQQKIKEPVIDLLSIIKEEDQDDIIMSSINSDDDEEEEDQDDIIMSSINSDDDEEEEEEDIIMQPIILPNIYDNVLILQNIPQLTFDSFSSEQELLQFTLITDIYRNIINYQILTPYIISSIAQLWKLAYNLNLNIPDFSLNPSKVIHLLKYRAGQKIKKEINRITNMKLIDEINRLNILSLSINKCYKIILNYNLPNINNILDIHNINNIIYLINQIPNTINTKYINFYNSIIEIYHLGPKIAESIQVLNDYNILKGQVIPFELSKFNDMTLNKEIYMANNLQIILQAINLKYIQIAKSIPLDNIVITFNQVQDWNSFKKIENAYTPLFSTYGNLLYSIGKHQEPILNAYRDAWLKYF
jgi:hypothetical protein